MELYLLSKLLGHLEFLHLTLHNLLYGHNKPSLPVPRQEYLSKLALPQLFSHLETIEQARLLN
jgi:hypothetical protein